MARKRLVSVAAAGALGLGVIVLILSGGGDADVDGWEAPFGDGRVATPQLLPSDDGWSVSVVDLTDDRTGEMVFDFDNGPQARLLWMPGPFERWAEDRACCGATSTSTELFGVPVQVSHRPDRPRYSALWSENDRTVEFTASPVEDLAAFLLLLDQLERVELNEWLEAMPPSLIPFPSRSDVVTSMLSDVPVPGRFSSAALIDDGAALQSWYQIGVDVTRTVGCAWLTQWINGTQDDNAPLAGEAAAALAGAAEWQVLQDMAALGGWSQSMWMLADLVREADGSGIAEAEQLQIGSTIGCGK